MEPLIVVTSPDDLRFSDILNDIRDSDLVNYLIFFDGDRRSSVRFVSLAISDDYRSAFGVATLAPTDELGCYGPHIMGVWIRPDYRRMNLGMRLVLALISTSLDHYASPPTFVAATRDALDFALSVARRDPRLLVVDPFKRP